MPAGASQGATSIEVYGFTAWITTGVAYGAFLCWAYIPERCLQALGISYYPDKYWALAVPSWICVAVVAAYWAYESWNESLVPPLESLSNIQGGAFCMHLLLHGSRLRKVIHYDCRCLQQITCQPGAA
ncbi:TPA: hypothetical protein ACH3X3_001741 [Trebouxia sp. C0006]